MKYKGIISTLEALEAAINNTTQYLGVSKLVKKSDNMVLGYMYDKKVATNYNHGDNVPKLGIEYTSVHSNVPITHELHLSHESKILSSANVHIPNQDICMSISKGCMHVIIYEDRYYFDLTTISIIGKINKIGLLRIIDNKYVLYLQSIPEGSVQEIINYLNS